MENEINVLINQDNNDISNELYFKKDYHDQKIDDKNWNFLKNKQSIITTYGENAKLFQCLKDDIYFFSSEQDCKSYPFYRQICPICKKQICFYCSKFIYEKDGDIEKGTCCLKRRLKYLFFYDGYIYINHTTQKYINNFYRALMYFILPIISFIFMGTSFQRILFETLKC